MVFKVTTNEQDKFGIYRIVNTINGKVYIGQTRDRFIERYWNHKWKLKNGIHDNKHLQKAFDKYGSDVFEFEIVEVVSDIDKLNNLERHYISEYMNKNKSYNIQFGGQDAPMKNIRMSDETKKKISEKNKIALKGKTQSDITKAKKSKKMMGKTQWDKCKISYQEAKFIKECLLSGTRPIDISETYGIDYKIINNIYSKNTYKSVYVEGWEDFYNNKPKLRNMRDGKLKKLSREDVGKIERLIKLGKTKTSIAKQMGVSRNTLYSYLK